VRILQRLAVFFTSLLIWLAVIAPGARAAGTSDDVWIVRQTNQLLGVVTLYLGQDRAKVVTRNGDLTITCCAPDWNVVLYRKSDNVGVKVPMVEWHRAGFNLMNPKGALIRGKHENTVDPDLKIDCQEVVLKSDGRLFGANDPMIFQSSKKTFTREIRYKYTRSIPLNKNVDTFLTGMFNVPDFGGIPLALTYVCTDGTVEKPYSTFSLKKGQSPSPFFTYPKGYTTTPLNQILISKRQQNRMQEILHDALDEESTTQKKTEGSQPHK
jgi:hypothetical protein